MSVLSAPADAQQASITLRDSSAALCHHNDTAWTVEKTGAVAGGTATWTVTVTKGATTNNQLVVDGYVRVENTGTANATIGNIVVNLQRQRVVARKTYWISAAADVADATNGDAAVAANIVAAGSAETASLNASNGPGNYTVVGARGTFAEGAGSGTLEFTDASFNTAFSLTPQVSLAPGQAVNLLFQAAFDNTVLAIPAGALVRAEVLVTFGNAGGRGGSGASAKNIDINGNSVLDADEANVRTVPARLTLTVPPLEACNSAVTLSDTEADIATTGTVTFSNFTTDIGGGSGTQVLTDSGTFSVSVDVDAGGSGGTVGNTAHLDGADDFVVVNGPPDPITGLPIYSYSFPCCVGVHLTASSVLDVGASNPGFEPGDFCTLNAGHWGQPPHGQNSGTITGPNFAAVYPGGSVEVGVPGASGFSMRFTSPTGVQNYLPNGGGGPASVLTADLVNPTDSSSGTFGAQVLTLELNVDYGDAGQVVVGTEGGIGDLTYCDPTSSLNGLTVRQVLATANTALGGGGFPAGYDAGSMKQLVEHINGSFEGCTPNGWAQTHLCP